MKSTQQHLIQNKCEELIEKHALDRLYIHRFPTHNALNATKEAIEWGISLGRAEVIEEVEKEVKNIKTDYSGETSEFNRGLKLMQQDVLSSLKEKSDRDIRCFDPAHHIAECRCFEEKSELPK